ncbi:CARDB domain-containing protein [Halorientalis salina]|uniref:CARDB domain-containing protein n=1 Tax=Halorientalis salina TaxID=2932266 RepID=UPI0010AD62D6|nr:CARDB domain-containing protein [Halorientalis salina]
MASVSVSHMILFIASIVVAASVVGVFTDSISQVSEAIDDRGVSVSENVRTDIEIISDSGSTNVYDENDNRITIHVKNTGSETLAAEPTQIDLFVNGRYQSVENMDVSLVSDSSTWGPGEVARINISNQDLGGGDHRVKVIINQDEEVFEFHI